VLAAASGRTVAPCTFRMGHRLHFAAARIPGTIVFSALSARLRVAAALAGRQRFRVGSGAYRRRPFRLILPNLPIDGRRLTIASRRLSGWGCKKRPDANRNLASRGRALPFGHRTRNRLLMRAISVDRTRSRPSARLRTLRPRKQRGASPLTIGRIMLREVFKPRMFHRKLPGETTIATPCHKHDRSPLHST
jgi:hypothetical protein